MGKRLLQELVYEAPAADVVAMLSDPAFREEVCRNQRATSYEVSVEGGVDAKQVSITMAQPTDKVPSFAKKIVGDSTTIVQKENWTSPTEAEIVVTIPGKPGEMRGTATIVERDGVTTETVDLMVTVKIPLVAGKIEELIAKLLGSALRAEERTGRAWLAR